MADALAKLHDFIDRAGPDATLMVSLPFRDTLRHKGDPRDWQWFPKGRALYRGAVVELHDEWSWGWMVRKADRSFVEGDAPND